MAKRTARKSTATSTTVTDRDAKFLTRLVGVLTLLVAPMAMATPIQSLESIREAVERYAEQSLVDDPARDNVSVGRLDPRLRLRQCDEPLETFRNAGNRQGGRTTVGVRCSGISPWTIYVSVQVERYAEVYSLNRSLGRGDRIREQDITRVEANVADLPHGYYTDMEQLAGMELRRPARAGDILTPNLVAAPELVRRGDKVTVTAGNGTAQVTMRGEAMDSGGLGDRIRVRNPRSSKVVEGEITGNAHVRIL